MKSFFFKAGAVGGIIGVIAIYGFFKGWFNPLLENTPAEEMSNSVQLGAQSSWLVLSEAFAKQLSIFGFTFGDFEILPHFLSISSTGDTAKIEILQDGVPFLTVFELQLPDGMSYDNLVDSVEMQLGSINLQPAAFGSDSFYFLRDGLATNILPWDKSEALAFQFNPQDFDSIKGFISSLLVLR
ncbi:MAG: hypothetical protein V2A63_02545 [Patescibacteria group bacterium]